MSQPPPLQLYSVCVESTPPSSPIKLSGTMKWLTRAPTSIALPTSPTKARKSSTDDSHDTAFPIPTSPALPESNLTKAIRSLRSKPSLLSLYSKHSTPVTSPMAMASPQKEAARWLFRASTAQSIASTPSMNDLGDHFARSVIPVEEKTAEMQRRREASQKRVAALRGWLSSTTGNSSHPAHASPPQEPKSHLRIDSGIYPGPPFPFSASPTHHKHLSGPASPREDDILSTALFRLRSRAFTHYSCIGCGETHSDSLRDRGRAVWMLMRCRHLVHEGCFYRLGEGVKSGEEEEEHGKGSKCVGCKRLRGLLEGMGREDVEARVKRLVPGM